MKLTKKVAFYAELKPMQMNRYDCTITFMEKQPVWDEKEESAKICFNGEHIEAVISKRTGLMDSLKIDGTEYLKEGAFGLSVRDSGFDPWAMNVQSFPKEEGRFILMEHEEGADFSGVNAQLESVRIIENGQVRTIVEVLFHNSRAVMHYILPKKGRDVDLELTVEWMGCVVGEKQSGSAALTLTKNLSHTNFIVTKFIAAAICFTVSFLLGGLICYGYTYFLFGYAGKVRDLLKGMAAYSLFIYALLGVTVFSSSIARSTAVAALLSFCGFLVLILSNLYPCIPQTSLRYCFNRKYGTLLFQT